MAENAVGRRCDLKSVVMLVFYTPWWYCKLLMSFCVGGFVE